jgi:hypothetical protein
MRTAIALALVHLAYILPSQPARADWLPVLSGPVARVVAAGKQAAALRKQEVLVLREDGRLLSRMADTDAGANERPHVSAKQAAEQTLDRLEIPEIDRGTDYTDDLVTDESRLGERRSWRADARNAASVAATVLPPVLSANAAEIWIGNGRGLFRVGEGGETALRFGRAWAGPRMATSKDHVLVDKGTVLALLSTGSEPRFIDLPSPAQHFSISPTGKRLAWTAGTEIHIIGANGNNLVDAPTPIVDLVFCGETLVALLSGGVLAIPPEGRGGIRTAPSEARKLLCPSGPAMPWLALAQGLWISSDQGQQWTSVPVPGGRVLLDVAVSDHHVWLATNDGLYASVDATVTTELHDGRMKASKAARHPSPSWLAWLMPKVSLRAAATFAPVGHQIEGFALADFPLGAQALPLTTVGMANELVPGAPAEPARGMTVLDLRDADANCLTMARRKAVELAMTEPERARSYVTRAGHAAWLPELRVLVSRRYGRSESLDVSSSSTALSSPLGIDTVNDIRYEARATWDLGKLVFSTEELAAQTQALHMAELRRDIETTMNRLYFERRRLITTSTGDAQAQRLRSKEVEADLDAMSAGAFGACLSEKSTGGQ